MRSVKSLLLIWLCFSVTHAWADILPFPAHRPDPATLYKEHYLNYPEDNRTVGVSMAAADVKVRIKKMSAAAAGSFGADVVADFDMVGTSALKNGENINVFFPVDLEKNRPPVTPSFSAVVEGKPAADLQERSWTTDDEHSKQTSLWGFAWRIPAMKTGQKLHVSVRYSIVLPQAGGKPQFTYFLRSGARWDGPIGRETVNVETEKGLRLGVLSPVALKPAASSTNSLTWEIINAKPAEDIRLEVSPEEKP